MRSLTCLLSGILAMLALPYSATAQPVAEAPATHMARHATHLHKKIPAAPRGSLAWAHKLLHTQCVGVLCHARSNGGGYVDDFELAARAIHQHYQKVIYHPGTMYASAAAYAAALLGKNGSACLMRGTVFKIHQSYDTAHGRITKRYNTTDIPLFDRYAQSHGGLPHPDYLMTIPYKVAKRVIPSCTSRAWRQALAHR